MSMKRVGLLLLVLALAAIFVIQAAAFVRHMRSDETPEDVAEAELAGLVNAIDTFTLVYKRLPLDLDELTRVDALTSQPFLAEVPHDPWGHPYEFRHVEPREPGRQVRDYVVSTPGPDGQLGTSDDMVYATRNRGRVSTGPVGDQHR